MCNIVPKFIDEGLSPVAAAIGNTLSDLWEIIFGGLHFKKEKIQLKRREKLEQFKNRLTQEISKIEPENLCEAKVSVIGPILEASKYYFDEEKLRDMYAKLIASSLDNRKTGNVHPSFIDIIKNLAANDAIILKEIYLSEDLYLPAVSYKITSLLDDQNNNVVGHLETPYITTYLIDENIREDEQIISLDVLNRLGLIAFEDSFLTEEKSYAFEKNTKLYADSEKKLNDLKKEGEKVERVIVDRKLMHLTPVGIRFCDVCLK